MKKQIKQITIKIDEDNDIFELMIKNYNTPRGLSHEIFTLDNVYQSKYAELFDELNFLIDSI
tara:strand:- start:259 stop:444 length:186 start_codon:yes stop_codon:yes gene_type:complete